MGERQMSCISLAKGERIWHEMLRLGQPRYTSLVIADGKIFYPWEGLLCVRAGGREYEALYDGKIYLRMKNHLACYDLRAPGS